MNAPEAAMANLAKIETPELAAAYDAAGLLMRICAKYRLVDDTLTESLTVLRDELNAEVTSRHGQRRPVGWNAWRWCQDQGKDGPR
jgi:hypothetical protein